MLLSPPQDGDNHWEKIPSVFAYPQSKTPQALAYLRCELVAWGRIELPTRGFSTHLSKLQTVQIQSSKT
jgi:hypothetical protein